jgi:hypothetical protein
MGDNLGRPYDVLNQKFGSLLKMEVLCLSLNVW